MSGDVHVVAIDWSGRRTRAAEYIWIADAAAGQLEDLTNGLGRVEIVNTLVALAGQHERLVVGLDFAFGLPAWWSRDYGHADAPALWAAMRDGGEDLIANPPSPPFWGAAGTSPPPPDQQ